MANTSFTLGMVASIADKLTAMKAGRDQANNDAGRSIVVPKSAVVDAELDKLDLKLRTVRRATRMVSPKAYDAGGVAGATLRTNAGSWSIWRQSVAPSTRRSAASPNRSNRPAS